MSQLSNVIVDKDLALLIGKHIAYCRRLKGVTQDELASYLCYSDKNISKWERGDGIPDVPTLARLAKFFGVSINDFIGEKKIVFRKTRLNRIIKWTVPFLSATIIWVVATILYASFEVSKLSNRNYLVFIFAIPAYLLILLIFNLIWGRKLFSYLLISVIIWTTFISFLLLLNNNDLWIILIIGVPLQVLVSLWFLMSFLLSKKRVLSIKKTKDVSRS